VASFGKRSFLANSSTVNDDHLDTELLRRRMQRNAPWYAHASAIVDEIGDRLWDHLDPIKLSPERILEVGARSSTISKRLRQRYPKAVFVSVGPVAQLLPRPPSGAAQWLSRTAPIHSSCARSDALPLSASNADLLVANLSLDACFSHRLALSEWARVCRPGALLLFTSLGPQTCRELRMAAGRTLPSPNVPLFLDMHDTGDLVQRSGFGDVVMEAETLTLEYQDFSAIRRDLRALGLTDASPRRSRGLLGRARYAKLVEAYDEHRIAGRLPLTVEVVFGHGWREPKQPGNVSSSLTVPFA